MAARRRPQAAGSLPVFEEESARKNKGVFLYSSMSRMVGGDMSLTAIYLGIMSVVIFYAASYSLYGRFEVPDESGHYPVVDPEDCGSDAEKVLNVFEWSQKHGAYIHPNVTTGLFDLEGNKVRGLMAKGDIAFQEKVFMMPSNLLLNLGMVRSDPVMGRVYNETNAMHDGLGGLAVFLMRESMNKSSFWRPYICSLPSYVPLPIFFSEKKLQRVKKSLPEDQWSNLDNLMDSRRDTIELKFTSIMPALFRKYPDLFPIKDYSYPRFAWACSIIMSRTWGKKFQDAVLQKKTGNITTQVQTLVPAADMPNHLPTAFQARTLPSGTLFLVAHKNLTRGDQVYISYGPKCNAEFLAHYGFVPYNNTGVKCKHGFGFGNATFEGGSVLTDDGKNASITADERVREWRKKWRSHFAKFYTMLNRASKEQELQGGRWKQGAPGAPP